MKWVKRIGIVILSLPFLLLAAGILFEILGICVNHAATSQQTKQLRANLAREISDIEILGVSSETGNTGGTGNHVDCLSRITFSTEMTAEEIEHAMSAYYDFEEWYCSVEKKDDRSYSFTLVTPAPFADNIEGH